MQDYRKLRVWQKAHCLAVDAYALPAYLKVPEGWALRDQILKAAISIPSNIAEGVEEARIQTSSGSSGTRWDPAMNLKAISRWAAM